MFCKGIALHRISLSKQKDRKCMPENNARDKFDFGNNWVSNYLKKNQEIIQYFIWGVLSTILNIGLFQILILLHLDYKVSNIITLVIVKIFCYVTNKLFVFRTPFVNLKYLLKEICAFFVARSMTFLLDFFGVMIMIEYMRVDAFLSKCFVSVTVIIINFILSKKFVFHTK